MPSLADVWGIWFFFFWKEISAVKLRDGTHREPARKGCSQVAKMLISIMKKKKENKTFVATQLLEFCLIVEGHEAGSQLLRV